jgi:NitT/TauT family transport system permease protein
MSIQYYSSPQNPSERRINGWDLVALLSIIALIFGLSWGAKQMAAPYSVGEVLPISLDPSYLPGYALLTVLRLFIALFFSLVFTFVVGTLAAKSRRAEQWIIPAIDILQSVPVLSFLSITVVGFIRLFPGSLLGPECACLFAIFTAQVWNMVFGFYQSVKMLPSELKDAAEVFNLSAWQKFWLMEVPFSLPGLLWNMMMSVSASWFFVVLSEAILVSNQSIHLPGIGSYIAVAIEHSNKKAIFYAVFTMLLVIFLYDQCLFRPLMKWSEKFRMEGTSDDTTYSSWLFNLLQKTRFLYYLRDFFAWVADYFVNLKVFIFLHQQWPQFKRKWQGAHPSSVASSVSWSTIIWRVITTLIIGMSSFVMFRFFLNTTSYAEISHVLFLGTLTSLRIIILIFLCSLIWIPVGVWIGMRPRWTSLAQPIIQFCAAFPANLIYPIVVITIVMFHLNVNIWLSPLMILGTQWYILFNVIAGASRIPVDLWQVTENFSVKGFCWWRRLGFPAIFPYYVTGAITAAGGAWNASIVAEWVSWGQTTLKAQGLGTYIHQYTEQGDFSRVALGTVVMCLFVLAFNCFFWRPLYSLAHSRFQMDREIEK